jgi:gliding motility-associated-like protein
VTSDQGCLDTAEQTLIIKDEILLFIPNAISPNNDGINDVFRVVGLGYTHIDITIYNRWGEQIYTSDDFTEWDATYKGEKVQMGAYVYIMNIVDNRGRKYHEYGEIQVVR